MDIPVWFQVGSLAVLTTILILDLLLIIKRPHIPSTKESALWVAFYVTLALIFGGVLWAIGDAQHAGEFITGWLTEYSLSIDNLFVFVLIMGQFAVPRKHQQLVLMVGIIIALILRAIFIALGAVAIERLSWIFYIFGAFLIYTAIRQLKSDDHSEGPPKEPWVVRRLRKVVPISDDYDGSKLRTTINGKRYFTPMLIVFVSIGITDLMFAVDSIPAIYGITQEPFLVFAANIFALMGLRQLYFLLGGLLEKLKYLHFGVAFILGFIGVKLILHALHVNELPFLNNGEPVLWVPDIGNWTSLGVIIGSMAIATIASLIASSRDEKRAKAAAHAVTSEEADDKIARDENTARDGKAAHAEEIAPRDQK